MDFVFQKILEGTSAWKRPWNMTKLQGVFLPSATSNKLITLRSLVKRTKVESFGADWWWALSLAAEKSIIVKKPYWAAWSHLDTYSSLTQRENKDPYVAGPGRVFIWFRKISNVPYTYFFYLLPLQVSTTPVVVFVICFL